MAKKHVHDWQFDISEQGEQMEFCKDENCFEVRVVGPLLPVLGDDGVWRLDGRRVKKPYVAAFTKLLAQLT